MHQPVYTCFILGWLLTVPASARGLFWPARQTAHTSSPGGTRRVAIDWSGRIVRLELLALLLGLTACSGVPRTTASPPPTAINEPVGAGVTAPAPRTGPSARPVVTPTSRPSTTAMPRPHATAVPSVPSPVARLSAAERQHIFTQAWQIIKEQYLYPDFRGLDWDAIRDEYRPLVETATSDEAFYELMGQFVDQLGDHHSRFMPPSAAVSEDAFASGHESHAGIGALILPGPEGGFIQTVYPDSPAASADLRPRDRIIGVDDRPYVPGDGDLRGPPGSKVRLSVVRPGEKSRDIILVRQEIQSRVAPYSRRFPGDIGYVWIPTLWVNDMDEQVSGALTELIAAGQLNGLILDLRGNGGGWEHVLSGILSHFSRGQVGTFYNRSSVRPLVVSSPAGPDLRGEPLVVLIDQETTSYAEVLAGVLQQESGVRVVGAPSAGNTETIYAHKLSDGSRLWLAQEGFRLQNGAVLEGRGVQPDVVVDVDWKRYSEDDDPQLLEALRLLGAGPK